MRNDLFYEQQLGYLSARRKKKIGTTALEWGNSTRPPNFFYPIVQIYPHFPNRRLVSYLPRNISINAISRYVRQSLSPATGHGSPFLIPVVAVTAEREVSIDDTQRICPNASPPLPPDFPCAVRVKTAQNPFAIKCQKLLCHGETVLRHAVVLGF